MDSNRLARLLEGISYKVGPKTQVEGLEIVDLVFFTVGINVQLSKVCRDEIFSILKDWPESAFGSPVPSLEEGPTYIHMGAVLGDQSTALTLMAVGKVLKLWDVITPATFGIYGDQARELASLGFIVITGYTKQKS